MDASDGGEDGTLLVRDSQIGEEARILLEAEGASVNVVKVKPEAYEPTVELLSPEGNFSGLEGVEKYLQLKKRLARLRHR